MNASRTVRAASYTFPMRHTLARQIIQLAVREHTDPAARVPLCGSRSDDHARGGDIDFLVQSTLPFGGSA